ncbi:ATP-dependent DNA ligase [Bradyrhizobium sp. F1.13.1]
MMGKTAALPRRRRYAGDIRRIVEAALGNRSSWFVFDGDAVLLSKDGVSDVGGLRSRKHDASVQLYAFDALVAEGALVAERENLRRLPLSLRKTNLARLLARRVECIHLAPFEQGEVGPDLPPRLSDGPEGLVSKHLIARTAAAV